MNFIFCIVIVIISTGIGRLFAGRMAQRLEFFREYQNAVTYLSDKVVGLNMELYKALSSCRSTYIRSVFMACAYALKKTPQTEFSDIWRQSFEQQRTDFGYLSKTDSQIILDGGTAVEALCKNPSEKQAALYLKRIGDYTAALELEKVKKCKLYNTAGVLAGLMVALLVI